MLRYLTLSVSAIGLLSIAAADPVLDMMHAASNDGPNYAYETSFSWDGIAATGSVDPSAPIGQRLTILSPAESDWSDDFR